MISLKFSKSFLCSNKLRKASFFLSYYQVIVIELATDNEGEAVPAQPPDYYKRKDLYTYDEARKKKPTLVPYIAAEFNAMDFHDYQKHNRGIHFRRLFLCVAETQAIFLLFHIFL